MIPYLAQGANSAIEDGATIGLILGKITSKSQLPQALQMFQTMRKARGEAVARESLKMVSMDTSPDETEIPALVTDMKSSAHFITCAMALSSRSVIRCFRNTLIPSVQSRRNFHLAGKARPNLCSYLWYPPSDQTTIGSAPYSSHGCLDTTPISRLRGR